MARRVQELDGVVGALSARLGHIVEERRSLHAAAGAVGAPNKDAAGVVPRADAAPAARQPGPLGEPEHLGCYADLPSQRDLPELLPMFSVDPQRCAYACADRGFKYAGLQDGAECWCGTEYGRYGASTACKRSCTANLQRRCGGPYANDVYRAGRRARPVSGRLTGLPEPNAQWLASGVDRGGAVPRPEGSMPELPFAPATRTEDSSVRCWTSPTNKRYGRCLEDRDMARGPAAEPLPRRAVPVACWDVCSTCTFKNLYMMGADPQYYFQFGPLSRVEGAPQAPGGSRDARPC